MRWSVVAIVLAGVSLLLLALTLGAAFTAVLPARGGEDLLRFAGESLIGAIVTALAATASSVLAWRRRLSSGRNVVAIIGLVAAPGVVTFVGRYAGTDRRGSPPGRDQGKLVLTFYSRMTVWDSPGPRVTSVTIGASSLVTPKSVA